MAIIAKDDGGGPREKPEPGLHNAVCSKMFDLGIQEGFGGKPQHKVVIYWELEETMQTGDYAGKRFVLSRTYTLSLNEKASLRRDLESWRGKGFTEQEVNGFDIEVLIGVPCTINVIHDDKSGRAKIAGIMPKQKTAEALTPELPDDFCPPWIAEALGKTPPEEAAADFDSDIPF